MMKVLKILGLTLLFFVILTGFVFYEGDIPKDVVDARYSSPASQFLNLGDAGRIHYRDEGNHRGLPVVLVHGSNASLHTYEQWVDRLEDTYRVITLDLPAHGLTGAIPSNDYTDTSYLATVDAVVDHLGIDQFVLGGNSMGGWVTWRYALEHPHRVIGMVLIDSSVPRDWYEAAERTNAVWAFSLLRNEWVRRLAVKFDPYYLTVQGIEAAYTNTDVIDDALIQRYYDLNLRAGTRAATMARFGSGRGDTYDLSTLSMPTLIMWGKEDALTPFAWAEMLKNTLPNTSTAYYEGIGHVPMEEVPDQSADDLRAFLESLPAG